MATDYKQEKEFIEKVIHPNVSTDILEDTIAWIQKNLSPEEVFDEKVLKEYAALYEVEDIFSDKTLEQWAKNQDAERVCDESTLEYWAEHNGYEKIPDNKA